MAFKSSITTKTLESRLAKVEGLAGNIRNVTQQLFNVSAARDVQARSVNSASNNIARTKTEMVGLVGVDLAQYAKDQRNDQTYEIETEYLAMISVIDAFLAWIDTSTINAGAWSEVETVTNGEFVPRMLTSVQTGSLRIELQKILDVIAV